MELEQECRGTSDASRRWYENGPTGQHQRAVYDVIVVGSGCSGLTTALVAAKYGLKVLVLEKTKYFGGTTAISGGGVWVPNNRHQKSIGIRDSARDAESYLQEVMGDLYDPEKVNSFLKSGPDMVEWVEANTTVRFKPVPLPDYHVSKKGASRGRTMLSEQFDGRRLGSMIKNVRYPIQGYSAFGSMQADPAELPILTDPFGSIKNLTHVSQKMIRYAIDLAWYGKGTQMANGNALVGRLLHSAQNAGVELRHSAQALEPVIEHGRVAGLRIQHESGGKVVYARRGVVLASGGFGRSDEAKKFVPGEWCAASRGNTGDGKRIGVACGGALPPKNPTNAIFAPVSLLSVPDGPVRRYPHFSIDRCKPGSIIVGPSGRRFVNESEPYQEFVTAMHQNKIEKAFYIGDRMHLRKYGMGMALPWPYPIWNLLRKGYLDSAPTIAALAKKIGVPVESLEQTVAECNSFAKTGKDLQFQRGENAYDQFYGDLDVKPNTSLGTCSNGPFYALPLFPGNVSTLYGLATNSDAQVMDKDGSAVDGLFAVGCDQNSVFKGAYPGGGSSIGPGMTFGYRAGRKLVEMEI